MWVWILSRSSEQRWLKILWISHKEHIHIHLHAGFSITQIYLYRGNPSQNLLEIVQIQQETLMSLVGAYYS